MATCIFNAIDAVRFGQHDNKNTNTNTKNNSKQQQQSLRQLSFHPDVESLLSIAQSHFATAGPQQQQHRVPLPLPFLYTFVAAEGEEGAGDVFSPVSDASSDPSSLSIASSSLLPLFERAVDQKDTVLVPVRCTQIVDPHSLRCVVIRRHEYRRCRRMASSGEEECDDGSGDNTCRNGDDAAAGDNDDGIVAVVESFTEEGYAPICRVIVGPSNKNSATMHSNSNSTDEEVGCGGATPASSSSIVASSSLSSSSLLATSVHMLLVCSATASSSSPANQNENHFIAGSSVGGMMMTMGDEEDGATIATEEGGCSSVNTSAHSTNTSATTFSHHNNPHNHSSLLSNEILILGDDSYLLSSAHHRSADIISNNDSFHTNNMARSADTSVLSAHSSSPAEGSGHGHGISPSAIRRVSMELTKALVTTHTPTIVAGGVKNGSYSLSTSPASQITNVSSNITSNANTIGRSTAAVASRAGGSSSSGYQRTASARRTASSSAGGPTTTAIASSGQRTQPHFVIPSAPSHSQQQQSELKSQKKRNVEATIPASSSAAPAAVTTSLSAAETTAHDDTMHVAHTDDAASSHDADGSGSGGVYGQTARALMYGGGNGGGDGSGSSSADVSLTEGAGGEKAAQSEEIDTDVANDLMKNESLQMQQQRSHFADRAEEEVVVGGHEEERYYTVFGSSSVQDASVNHPLSNTNAAVTHLASMPMVPSPTTVLSSVDASAIGIGAVVSPPPQAEDDASNSVVMTTAGECAAAVSVPPTSSAPPQLQEVAVASAPPAVAVPLVTPHHPLSEVDPFLVASLAPSINGDKTTLCHRYAAAYGTIASVHSITTRADREAKRAIMRDCERASEAQLNLQQRHPVAGEGTETSRKGGAVAAEYSSSQYLVSSVDGLCFSSSNPSSEVVRSKDPNRFFIAQPSAKALAATKHIGTHFHTLPGSSSSSSSSSSPSASSSTINNSSSSTQHAVVGIEYEGCVADEDMPQTEADRVEVVTMAVSHADVTNDAAVMMRMAEGEGGRTCTVEFKKFKKASSSSSSGPNNNNNKSKKHPFNYSQQLAPNQITYSYDGTSPFWSQKPFWFQSVMQDCIQRTVNYQQDTEEGWQRWKVGPLAGMERSVIVNSVDEVCNFLRVSRNGYYAAVALLDTFLAVCEPPVDPSLLPESGGDAAPSVNQDLLDANNFRCLIIATVYIASKLHDIQPPHIHRVIEALGVPVSCDALCAMELRLMSSLNFYAHPLSLIDVTHYFSHFPLRPTQQYMKQRWRDVAAKKFNLALQQYQQQQQQAAAAAATNASSASMTGTPPPRGSAVVGTAGLPPPPPSSAAMTTAAAVASIPHFVPDFTAPLPLPVIDSLRYSLRNTIALFSDIVIRAPIATRVPAILLGAAVFRVALKISDCAEICNYEEDDDGYSVVDPNSFVVKSSTPPTSPTQCTTATSEFPSLSYIDTQIESVRNQLRHYHPRTLGAGGFLGFLVRALRGLIGTVLLPPITDMSLLEQYYIHRRSLRHSAALSRATKVMELQQRLRTLRGQRKGLLYEQQQHQKHMMLAVLQQKQRMMGHVDPNANSENDECDDANSNWTTPQRNNKLSAANGDAEDDAFHSEGRRIRVPNPHRSPAPSPVTTRSDDIATPMGGVGVHRTGTAGNNAISSTFRPHRENDIGVFGSKNNNNSITSFAHHHQHHHDAHTPPISHMPSSGGPQRCYPYNTAATAEEDDVANDGTTTAVAAVVTDPLVLDDGDDDEKEDAAVFDERLLTFEEEAFDVDAVTIQFYLHQCEEEVMAVCSATLLGATSAASPASPPPSSLSASALPPILCTRYGEQFLKTVAGAVHAALVSDRQQQQQ